MEFTAASKYVRVSPQKVRLVLELIKGRRVEDALNTLAFTNKRIAPDVEKLLRSAIQNANYISQEKGEDVDVDNLYVKNAFSNEGPRMKRIRPAPMGRAFRYQRRMAHIHIVLAEKNKLEAAEDGDDTAPEKKAATRKPARARGAGRKTAKSKTAGKKK